MCQSVNVPPHVVGPGANDRRRGSAKQVKGLLSRGKEGKLRQTGWGKGQGCGGGRQRDWGGGWHIDRMPNANGTAAGNSRRSEVGNSHRDHHPNGACVWVAPGLAYVFMRAFQVSDWLRHVRVTVPTTPTVTMLLSLLLPLSSLCVTTSALSIRPPSRPTCTYFSGGFNG